jgi:hypothetical protein
MKAMLWICVIVLLGGQMGCQWYEDYRIKKGTADIREETAEMMQAYRVCLQRYAREPPKATEHTALRIYNIQSLREVEIKREFGR